MPLTLTVDASERLVLAAAEAFNNVVLHAEGESFAVTVAVEGDACTVSVADSGHGFCAPTGRPAMPPANEVNSRGLALMYALVDKVEVVSTARGTAVVLAQALPAPAPDPGANGVRAGRRATSTT
jgi:anti-sigma regulatory factor (Ser/Thr protein kinase)